MMGTVEDMQDIEEMEQVETAFMDMYGDFEESVAARRDQITTNSATILRVARAQSITDFSKRDINEYTISPGYEKYMRPEDVLGYRKTDQQILNLNNGMK